MNKLFVCISCVLIALSLTGCVSNDEEVPPVPEFTMVHPSMPTPPSNPGVVISVITDENIKPGVAYVGFEYNEWLAFAKWMHEYKAYNDDLKKVITLYRQQDPQLNKESEK